MAPTRSLLRILWAASVAVLTMDLLTLAAFQFEQRLLCYRAERLMADMHAIRLYQTTWAEAQKLMQNWGGWGHYDETSTSAECRYQITLSDISHPRFKSFMQRGGFRVYS
jgi:hypothetical protein